MHETARIARKRTPRGLASPLEALALALAVIAGAAAGACAPPPRAPEGEPGPAPAAAATATASAALDDPSCGAGGARCTAADQCCSNRCDISDPRAGTGVCRSLDVLEGPLVELPQSVKAGDFRLTPPPVVDVQAVPGRSGGSLVFVRFGRDRRLGRQVVLPGDRGDLVLHDDGTGGDERASDGVFTGAVAIDFASLHDAAQTRLTALRRLGISSVPVFDGRQVVGSQNIDFTITRDRISFIPFPMPFLLNQHKSLAVTNVNVVEDPARTFNPCTDAGTALGKWTFGYLMTQMANEAVTGINPSDFVLDWLSRWLSDQPVGLTTVATARPSMSTIIAAWPKLPDGRLDLAHAPFKLLAIMNRIDLAGNPSYGSVGGAEARFVFELLDQATCDTRPFFAILEYGVPRHNCPDMKAWAQQWIDLGGFTLGSPAYNAALEAITEQFAAANAEPSKPNGSAINQVRSNEIALQFPPNMREFKLTPTAPPMSFLREATVKQTPDPAFNGNLGGARAADLGTWIIFNLPAVTAGTYTVPPLYPFQPGGDFLGAESGNNHDFWKAPGAFPNQARFQLSLNTCNGCHGRETDTNFVMVNAAPFGSETTLADFLTGETVTDPVDLVTTRTFNDLLFRAGRLQAFADASCIPSFPPPPPVSPPPPPPPASPFPLPPIHVSPLLATD